MTRLIQEYVTRQAERRPDAPALVLGDERLTYGQLEEESNRLARLLAESGCKRGDRVSIFQPKKPAAIVSMLATLKVDCAYVPIDVASPAPRVAKIIDAAEPRVILVDPSSAALLDATLAETELAQSPLVGSVGDGPLEGERFASSFSPADWEGQDAGPVSTANGPDDIAHLLFTSGSTGTPKGVMIKHENVVTFVEWATSYFQTKESDRISGHPPLHFDLSTFDIYGTFLAGAELHLVSASLNLIPQKLAEFIRSSELTQWFAVPSIFTFMAKFEAIEQDDFPTVERVLWCGEVLPTPVLVHWMKRVPHATFTNLYGPTEATIASSYYTVAELPASETEPIPIGVACEGEELLVLDSQLEPVADGEIGDLYIGGVGLSPGYWRDEEKTTAAFVADPRSPGARIYKTETWRERLRTGSSTSSGARTRRSRAAATGSSWARSRRRSARCPSSAKRPSWASTSAASKGPRSAASMLRRRAPKSSPQTCGGSSRRSCRPTCFRAGGTSWTCCRRTSTAKSTGGACASTSSRRLRRSRPPPSGWRRNVAETELRAKVQRIFAETLNIEVPSDETDLIEAGYIDSLALVELLFALEREFSVSVPLDELEIDNFRNVQSISELVAAANGRPG